MSRVFRDPIHWQPSSFEQMIGCQDLREHCLDIVDGVRRGGLRSGFNTLLTGASRTGKTSSMKLVVRSLTCQDFDFEARRPCNGSCSSCSAKLELCGLDGYQNHANIIDQLSEALTPIRFHYFPIDCSRLDSSKMNTILDVVRLGGEACLMIVYLDEVHHLARHQLDEMLLKPLEEYQAIWLATSAYIREEDLQARKAGLDRMFKNRFKKLSTRLPTVDELVDWLADRCEECGIKCDDPERTLTVLSERSQQVPGLALQVLSDAFKKRNKMLTRKMAVDYVF